MDRTSWSILVKGSGEGRSGKVKTYCEDEMWRSEEVSSEIRDQEPFQFEAQYRVDDLGQIGLGLGSGEEVHATRRQEWIFLQGSVGGQSETEYGDSPGNKERQRR